MLLPPKALRREVVRALADAFDEPRLEDIRTALVHVADYYRVRKPRVRWLSDSERRTKQADTHRFRYVISVMRPDQWRRQRKKGQPTDERGWRRAACHEIYHWVWWVNDERKADAYADAFMHGVED